jgi:hypothetical protein
MIGRAGHFLSYFLLQEEDGVEEATPLTYRQYTVHRANILYAVRPFLHEKRADHSKHDVFDFWGADACSWTVTGSSLLR